MKVLVRTPKKTVHEFSGRRTVAEVLRQLQLNPESVIVIRGNELLTTDVYLEESDEIEVRPAISGGAGRMRRPPAASREVKR